MTQFCIDLEGILLPDAIAAVVEAWYDAQNTEKFTDADNCKQKLLNHVCRLIDAKLLTVGSKMPSIKYLADRIGFYESSIYKAYAQLEEEGAIIAKTGKGYYIVDISKLAPASVI